MTNLSLPSDDYSEIDLRAELVRIDRDRAETLKLLCEAEKIRIENATVWSWNSPRVLALTAGGALVGALAVRFL
jgi:hypothetical protein